MTTLKTLVTFTVLTFSFATHANQELLARWQRSAPEVLASYQSLRPADRRFIEVFRGIDKVNLNKILLDQRGMKFNFGPNVFTSENPFVSVRYSNPRRFGEDLACDAVILKMQIPQGFFDSIDPVQNLISSESRFADLRLFITSVGVQSKKLKAQGKPDRDFATRLAWHRWIPFAYATSGPQRNSLKLPRGCQ